MRSPLTLILMVLAVIGVVGWVITDVRADDKAAHKYLGVDKCKTCHKAKSKGDQYTHWTESAHSKAFETLAGEKAKKVAAERKIADPQKAPECLKCHVTAFGVDKAMLDEKFKPELGVQCETCHGPGGDYWKKETMKDLEKAKAAGLIMPTEEVCVKCHNKESPFYKDFDFKTFSEKIKHPNPNKGKGGDDDKEEGK